MSTDSPSREVFEDVDPDPDAVLAEFDVESPADIADAGGAHDPDPADEIAVDDTTAAELFADLQDVATAARTRSSDDAEETARTDDGEDADPASETEDLEFEFVGDSDVVVRDDGEVIESTAADLRALTASEPTPGGEGDPDGDAEPTTAAGTEPVEHVELDRAGEATDSSRSLSLQSGAEDLTLVGPDPAPTRVENDSFSAVDLEAH